MKLLRTFGRWKWRVIFKRHSWNCSKETAEAVLKTKIPLLGAELSFPEPDLADKEGLVALGGDLSVQRLLVAYGRGIFPWTVAPVTWWSPDPRGILELDDFHVPRSLAKFLRKNPFHLTRDQAFRQVMEGCAEPRRGCRSTWITSKFLEAYTELHLQGYAHSVECWQGEQLVGGIYGVSLGGFFAGESMFHRMPNASKVALLELTKHLKHRGYRLFDLQMVTPITTALGATTISRSEYLCRLAYAVQQSCSF